MKVKIVLADDHRIFRQGIKAMLEELDGIKVVGEAENGRECVQLVKKLCPDIVIMDISMPDLNGIEATRQMMKEAPEVRIIGLSIHSDQLYIDKMLQAGATGYLTKDCSLDELLTAIKAAKTHRSYLSPRLCDTMIKSYAQQLAREESVLTGREREIVQLLAEGKAPKEISATLHISVKTVSTHRRKIMEKLNINNMAELIKYAAREGMIVL